VCKQADLHSASWPRTARPYRDLAAAGAGLEYEHLAAGLKDLIRGHGIGVISAARLAAATEADVRAFFGTAAPVPQEAERARLVREVRAPRPAVDWRMQHLPLLRFVHLRTSNCCLACKLVTAATRACTDCNASGACCRSARCSRATLAAARRTSCARLAAAPPSSCGSSPRTSRASAITRCTAAAKSSSTSARRRVSHAAPPLPAVNHYKIRVACIVMWAIYMCLSWRCSSEAT
jgi:hypothetical protein